MKTTFTDTLLIIMLPFIVSLSELRDWVAIALGIVSLFWVSYQLIASIRKDFFSKNNDSQI